MLQRAHGLVNLRNLLLVQAGWKARPGRRGRVERPEGVAEPRHEGGFRRVAGVPGGRRRDTRAPNAGFVGFFVKLVHIPINNILMT